MAEIIAKALGLWESGWFGEPQNSQKERINVSEFIIITLFFGTFLPHF